MKKSLPFGLLYGVGLVLLVSLIAAGASGCTVWRVRQAAKLAAQSEPFEQRGAVQRSGGGRLLIVGDSTAVGTGATSPQASVAGLIGRDFPGLGVVNRAQDGARFAEIAGQLQGSDSFDAVLILGGGNDVIRLTGKDRMTEEVTQTLGAASRLAPMVVILPSGNVGNAPFFFPPWSWLMTKRSRDLHAITRTAAAQTGALYVNVFAERAADPFAQQPKLYHAADGLHPSDAGYALWYAELNRQAGLAERLRALLAQATSADVFAAR